MNPKTFVYMIVLAAGFALFAPVNGRADDSAASVAAGGLVARRETRIVMAKEVLRISPTKIVVDYDFRNDTDEDVTTEVAFPVPPYTNTFPNDDIPGQSFQDFRLWVDGRPSKYATETKATLKGKDVTETLRANRIDIASLGHFDDTPNAKHEVIPVTRDFDRLPAATQRSLLKAGLFKGDDPVYAAFTTHLQYYWMQTFPAHSTVHVRHEYTPVVGFTQVSAAVDDLLAQMTRGLGVPKDDSDGVDLLNSFCADRQFLSAVSRRLHGSEASAKPDDKYWSGIVYPMWVDFILTSANTWKQPIEDFTLIVERGRPLDGYKRPMKDERYMISFCSPQNASVDKLDADHFQVHLTNFVPTSELHIGFFELPVAKSPQN